jgi:hypothetical protein
MATKMQAIAIQSLTPTEAQLLTSYRELDDPTQSFLDDFVADLTRSPQFIRKSKCAELQPIVGTNVYELYGGTTTPPR